ncbi:MAG: AAA family ATPase [Candidatus Eisenbacteria bacterium]|nr:AAA family ATPase [Candidatus Eisenbacteria bacterium]
MGRASILERISNHLRSKDTHPLVIFGVSGSGKTALMAHAAQRAREALPNARLFVRFVGATPGSSDGRALLENLCHHIYEVFDFDGQKRNLLIGIKETGKEEQRRRQRIEEEYSIPTEFQKLSVTFRNFLAKIPSSEKLILFLDALDQLSDSDHARSLYWLPTELPQNVRLIVSCLAGECLSVLQKKLPAANFVELWPMEPEESEKLLNLWLQEADRTLQSPQRAEVLAKSRQCGLPLYLKLAFEEASRWKSHTEKIELSPDISGVIRDLFQRLSSDVNHGGVMVSRSLGYLAAAKNGLTEDELLDILSQDEEVIADFLRRSPRSPGVKHLPVAVWSRLYFDLEPYLTERSADGACLMTFYHLQFSKVVAEEFLAGQVRVHRHEALAGYFGHQPLWIEKEAQENVNLRKMSELPYQQTHGKLWNEIEKTLCDLHFIEAKCAAGMTYDLIGDYGAALDALPEAQGQKRKELEHEARVNRYTGDLIAFARREISSLDIIPSVELWTDEMIRKDTERIVHNPTRLDRIQAFLQFANSECHGLVKFASHSGFRIQQACNSADSGPVGRAAESALNAEVSHCLLLHHRSQRFRHNPHPALVRTLEGHSGDVNSVSITPDGRRAVSGAWDRTLRVWDLGSGQDISIYQARSVIRSISGIEAKGSLVFGTATG